MVKELSDNICNNTDAPASFKLDVWKYFGFPIWRNEKGEKKTTDRQKIRIQQKINTPRSHRGHFKVQSLFNKCFFSPPFRLFIIFASVFFKCCNQHRSVDVSHVLLLFIIIIHIVRFLSSTSLS